MSDKFIYREFHSGTEFCPFLSVKNLILIQLILLILFFQGCIFFPHRQKSQLFLTSDNIENIIRNTIKQEDIVSEFYSTGTLTINGWILDTSVDIFIAGERDPFTLKIEISHSWGKPLFSLLIKEDRLEIRDFIDKKQYTGKFTPANLSRFLPNMDCSSDMIWSFFRAYPQFFSYARVYESTPGVLNLEDSHKNILGTMTFFPGKGIKEAVSSPPRFLNMKFTDFQKTGDIDYAVKTVVEDIKGKKDLTLKRNKIIFNKDIPDEIFSLKNQPYFEIVSLDD